MSGTHTNKMSAMINKSIYAIVEKLADEHGFDADEAMEFCDDEVCALVDLFPKEEKPKETPLDKARKNVSNWQKKLDADKFADEEAKAKHIEKLEKEKVKLAKLEPVVEKSTAKTTAVKEGKEKRIKRFSPQMATALALALKSEGIASDDKKVVDEHKKKVCEYIEALGDAEFRKLSLADHMKAYCHAEAVKDMPEMTGEQSDEEEEPAVEQLTLAKLQKIETIASMDDLAHFWDSKTGKAVTGPAMEDDEDMCDPFDWKGDSYVIGNKTGRVYKVMDDGDTFAGFVGVGMFKGMPHNK